MLDVGSSPQALPLFPLGTVLLPGAELKLRIFEARYLDLVRACSRQGTGFGVCLLLEGHEAGAGAAASAATGTEACITDFGTTEEGLLALTVIGGRRFHVERTRVRDNGLVVGEVHWRELPEPVEVRPEHGLLSQLLERIVAHFGTHAHARARDYDDADWVGWRLSELLPLSTLQRQAMLEEDDPHRRLDRILELLPDLPRE
jgi:uncharacterized protein